MKKLLCLDDSEIILETVKKVFEKIGYQVFTTSNWPEINSLIFREKIPIILMDVNMPGIKGTHICKVVKESVLKKNDPQFKILLFSSESEEELSKMMEEYDADGYICKESSYSEWRDHVEYHYQDLQQIEKHKV